MLVHFIVTSLLLATVVRLHLFPKKANIALRRIHAVRHFKWRRLIQKRRDLKAGLSPSPL